MQKVLLKLKTNQFLFQQLVHRDFTKKYKRTVLGVAWSVLSPLLTLLVMNLIFGTLLGSDIEHYTIYLFSGQLVFSFFNESTNEGMTSLLNNAEIFTKVNVPKYMFLFSKNVSSLINFGITLCIYFLFVLINGIPITWKFLLLLYPIACLVVFNVGVGLILSTMYVFVRDIMHIWEVFCTLLVYGSAIFYDPRQMESWMQYVINLNPIYWYITSVRSCVMWGEGLTANMLLIPFLCAALSLGLGIFVFKKYQDKFVLYM